MHEVSMAQGSQWLSSLLTWQRWREFNERFAVWSVTSVATMACAYVFGVIALIALPQAIHDSFFTNGFQPLPLVTWLSQSFLQLVLLSIVMVGQDVRSRSIETRNVEQFQAVMETLTCIRTVLTDEDTEICDLQNIDARLVRIESLLSQKKG
jgi:hypothetical protein